MAAPWFSRLAVFQVGSFPGWHGLGLALDGVWVDLGARNSVLVEDSEQGNRASFMEGLGTMMSHPTTPLAVSANVGLD
jgi:hypothetical protein